MKLDQFLATFATVTVLGCMSLNAQGTPQPNVSFTPGASSTWNADWNGITGRTYFLQFSVDLVNWNYAPTMRYGNSVHSLGIQTENADKFFIRLQYIDDPAVTTLAQAQAADFDGDGISNLVEIQTYGSKPFSLDSDSDGMPDAFEAQQGLNLTMNDSALDPDNDNATNLQEYQAGTNLKNFDTDRDGFPDGIEITTSTLNPLVVNTPGDADADGIGDIEEIQNGTSLTLADTDGDGINDIVEMQKGSDPTESASTPFNPEIYFGQTITETSAQPMGNLGVTNYSNGTTYNVAFDLYDRTGRTPNTYTSDPNDYVYSTNQEQWRLKIGTHSYINTAIPPTPAIHYGGKTLYLNPKKTHEIRLEHQGVVGLDKDGNGAAPDYNHDWALKSKDFIPVSSIPNDPITYNSYPQSFPFYEDFNAFYKSFSKITNAIPPVTPAGYDWTTQVTYLIPIVRLGYGTSYSGSDATGPRFRKISHFGRPIPDETPETESETDEATENSYVDAFDLSLHHDTSFASIPLSSSDLRLEANASVRETTWSSRSGLRPNEEITSPFGISWSSNLCAYIETTETFGSFTTRPTTVNVVDESGRPQRFGTTDMETFFSWPSSLTDKKTYLNTLTKVGNDLVLTKKYGNKLTYRPCDAWFMYADDRLSPSPTVVRHRYWRLVEVEDRFGSKVVYNYGNNSYSLIPAEISAVGRANQKLTIARSTNGRRIESITDAEGKVTQFHYSSQTFTVPSTSLAYDYQRLDKVTLPEGAEEHYTYEIVSDAETVYSKTTHHLHANLKSIQRDGQAQRVFTYAFDRTRKWYSHLLGRTAITASLTNVPSNIATKVQNYVDTINNTPQSGTTTRTQYGQPRLISLIEVPTMGIQSTFAKTGATQTTFGPVFSSTNGTDVTDAEGKKYTYTFGGTHGEIIDTDSSQTGNDSSVSNQWLIYHANTTLQYKSPSGTVLGSETYEFDPDSGLSLKKTTDFSGNITEWTFDEARPAGPRITLANNPDFFTNWADPTNKTDALGRIENYEYGNHRILTEFTDIHGTVTQYTVDAQGRRTEMTVTDAGSNLLQRETYEYTNATFPAFMTKKTRKAFSNLSGKSWEQDLVEQYVADAHGRLWKEIVDPSGENLQTIHTYDLNNRKTSTTDPRGLVTQFEYDERGRLVKTIFADSSFKTYAYNDNDAKISETDENGNSTLTQRDGLGRVTATARDMDGSGTINAGDIVSQVAYNDVGLPVKQIDPRGFASVTFYDDLHRPQHVFNGVPATSADGALATLITLASTSREVTHQEFSYNTTNNTGGGLLVPFKPTGTIRHNAVSMTRGQADVTLQDSAVYDDVYRPLQTSSAYAPALFNVAQFNYGTINGSGHESLMTTITDALGKVTRTTSDGLGRAIETIDGFGNSNANLVLTSTSHYTSTGLTWRVIDPLLRHAETEYDSTGRAVKSYQPDPSTGEITAQSPVTETEYDSNSNVVAVIDPLNRRTDFDYDNRNRKWRTHQPAVSDASNPDSPAANVRPTTTSTFDAVGNELSITDARGSIARKFYDKANRVVSARTNPQSGNPSSVLNTPGSYDITNNTEYDNGSLALSVQDGNGNITRNAYDALSRLIATVCDSADGDPAALPSTGLDPAAYRTANPTSALVSNLMDDAGNTIEVTDGAGNKTAFTFDGFKRKKSTIWDPEKTAQRTETFEYNALVQTSRVDGKGHRTNYSYDSLYRLTDVIYRADTSGTSHVDNRQLAYDKASRVLSVSYPNDSGSIRNVASTFDKLDRLTSETSAGVTHTYPSYDKVGNRLLTTYGRTGTTLVSTFDALNRLETCEERSVANTPSGRTSVYAYDLGGNVTRKTLPNGNATTTSRDKLGRTLLIEERNSSLALVSSFDYSQAVSPWYSSHDGVGNVLRTAENHTRSGMTDRVVVNSYDHCNRLDTETITPSGGSVVATDYGYDLADNRTSKAVGSTVTEYNFGIGNNGANSNQLISYGPVGQTVTHTFSYDNNGNRATRVTSAGTETYTWDEDNRLTTLDTPSGDYSYIYDHRTRRIVRDESAASGVVTELTFSGGTSVQESNTSGTVQVELIRGSDWGGGVGGVLFTIRSGQRSYNAYNSRGDVVSVTNDSGAATWQASYEAFGTRTEEDGTNTERQRANTKEEDPTGLLNEGHRYRDLEAGVFITRDPLGFVDGPNVYAYVRQNPWTFFDPEGLVCWALPKGYAESAEYREGFNKGAGLATIVAAPIAVGVVVTIYTGGAAAPYVAAVLGEGTAATITTGAIAGAAGGASTQVTSNALTGKPIGQNVPKAAGLGAALGAGGAVIGETVVAFRQGYVAGVSDESAAAVRAVAQAEVQAAAPSTTVQIDKAKYPQAAQHIEDAQAAGQPSVLTVDRSGAATNRAVSLKGHKKVQGQQLDEYPPAMMKEGGEGASVRPIDPSDNMGAGASMGNQLRKVKDGEKVKIEVTDSNK